MATGQAKMSNISGSQSSLTENSLISSDTEILNSIRQSFSDKNSALLLSEQRLRELAQSLESAVDESATLLKELHRTQELLEQTYHSQRVSEMVAARQKARIDRLKALLPGHCEMEVQHVSRKRKSKGKAEIICLTLNHAYLADEYFPQLYVEVHLLDDITGLLIKKAGQTSEWPPKSRRILADGGTVRLFPEYNYNNKVTDSDINELGTSDWNSCKELSRQLSLLIDNPSFSHDCLKDKHLELLRSGMTNLNQTLNDWPLTFRFDNIQLHDTLHTKEYQRLTLRIENLSIGNYAWSRLDYGLATVDYTDEFGLNPRLEFPESSRKVIQNWFAESTDGRGPRLELRFAKPNAFDREVWGKLSGEDQLLITALVTSLPFQLAALEKQNHSKQNWQDWKDLGLVMKRILASQFQKMIQTAN